MANTEKMLDQNNDIVSTKTLLHEAIPLTGTIVSGTYADANIKNYSHGMFQTVYDYPYLSSSANHIFDITVGYASTSHLSNSAYTQNSKKINIYNQMAQVLNGIETGSAREFDEDGDLTGGTKIKECIFFSFSRLLVKDEIKKGSFNMEFMIDNQFVANNKAFADATKRVKITDVGAADSFKINSPVGEYGILIADSTAGSNLTNDGGTLASGQKVGLVYYQAGVAVVTASLFTRTSTNGGILSITNSEMTNDFSGVDLVSIDGLLTGSSISITADAIRHRIYNISFNNTTELNSTIYFCRINHNEFNYSSNPSYLNNSQIRVKNDASDPPVSYITSVGLYDNNDRLLAVGKLSEPLRKDPTIEYTLRARLDY